MAGDRADVYKLAKESGALMVDLKFMDFPGLWQHFTVPIRLLDDDMFENGLGFDGSSIRGWQKINESDMLVIPDPATAIIDPVLAQPSCRRVRVEDPSTGARYPCSCRYIQSASGSLRRYVRRRPGSHRPPAPVQGFSGPSGNHLNFAR